MIDPRREPSLARPSGCFSIACLIASGAVPQQPVQPVFGIIKRVMGWRQMSMRGLDQANGEWNLVTMAWNIKRMHDRR
jgi:hypothetical protein